VFYVRTKKLKFFVVITEEKQDGEFIAKEVSRYYIATPKVGNVVEEN